MARPVRAAVAATLVALLACREAGDTRPPDSQGTTAATVDPWTTPPPIAAATFEAHLRFLADDAQEGRSPGTEADTRVQAHLVAAMRDLGLEPAFGGDYRQPFAVTDGVRLRGEQKSLLRIGKIEIAHALVPFGHDTGDAPISAPLLYVGHGIARADGEGDYEGLRDRVKGSVVVALAGSPDDPHLTPADTRIQSRVIAARDRGAIGFVLVDPDLEAPLSNHGQVTDLQLPVVAVGKAASAAVFTALGARAGQRPKIGARSKQKAELATPVEPITLQTANVGGVLRGSGAEAKRIVVGAHMDHLGYGTSASLAPGERAIHNGADDNASGVAAVLALAEALAAVPAAARPYDVVFYAFGAEEMGLLGSKHLVEQASEGDRKATLAMLNFDMVGRLREQAVIVSGTGTSSRWPALLERSAGELTVRSSDDGYGASDQTSFYEAGIPVLHFFTGPHDDYHKPSDDLAAINVDGAVAVAGLALRVIGALMQAREDVDYIKVARQAPARGGFRVSLGTVPDYAASVDGVKLSGVRPGGPAEQAGIKAGDVITQLGDRPIHNLDDYMAAFASMQPGVEIAVVVLRGDEPVTLKMTPQAPRQR
ncbi:MAG: M20/M25/M40 family metallo-hydrolase [Nannocystaceae bacterium]